LISNTEPASMTRSITSYMSKYLRWSYGTISSMDRPGFARRPRARRQLAVRLRHVGEVAARQLDRLLVGARQHVAAAGNLAGAFERAAQRLERRLLADRHLDHARAAHVEGRLALDHDHDVGERRQVMRSRRRRAEQDAHLRDHAGELDLVVERCARREPAREDLDLLGDAPAGRNPPYKGRGIRSRAAFSWMRTIFWIGLLAHEPALTV